MINSRKEFRMWLLVNDYTQKTLAQRLKITESTISSYSSKERYPIVFQLALKALEKEGN